MAILLILHFLFRKDEDPENKIEFKTRLGMNVATWVCYTGCAENRKGLGAWLRIMPWVGWRGSLANWLGSCGGLSGLVRGWQIGWGSQERGCE